MKFNGIDIDIEAAELAVDLSAEYIPNKKLPDKAFDVIDRACAYNLSTKRTTRNLQMKFPETINRHSWEHPVQKIHNVKH